MNFRNSIFPAFRGRRFLFLFLLSWFLLFFMPSSLAVLKIDVREGQRGKIPIVILPFPGEEEGKRNYSSIIASDLELTGQFAVRELGDQSLVVPVGQEKTDYAVWRKRGIEKFVTGEVIYGSVTKLPELRFELHDPIREQRVLAKSFSIRSLPEHLSHVSRLAHTASNVLYKSLTGMPGIFTSKLVFVSSEKTGLKSRFYRLCLSDIDGQNIFVLFQSKALLMSPVWSPGGQEVAFVSFASGQPELLIKPLNRRPVRTLAPSTGAAFSPAWSPDGRYLAYTGLKNGNSEIYVLDLLTKKVQRVTKNLAIDTEPAWAPDGTLYFTSDRSGAPQLYHSAWLNPNPQRVTFSGSYNSDAAVSPDGSRLAFLSVRDGKYSIVLRSLGEGSEIILSTGRRDESPRFLGNGFLLGFLTSSGSESVLGVATVDGLFGRQIKLQRSHVRAISWSPLRQ